MKVSKVVNRSSISKIEIILLGCLGISSLRYFECEQLKLMYLSINKSFSMIKNNIILSSLFVIFNSIFDHLLYKDQRLL